MKKLMLALLTLTALGVVSLPARANDDVVIQRADQDVFITGQDNTAIQTTVQQNRQSRIGNRGNTGNVQEARQRSDQLGRGNHSDQLVEQRNVQRRYTR